jgi:nucleoside-diphosphate-sugar epimerase
MHLLVLGLGYTASRFVALHGDRFETIRATSRSPAASTPQGVTMMPFDGERASDELCAALGRASHLLLSIPPGRQGDPVLACCRGAIEASANLAWIGYLSTIGVYGDHGGAWVDEMSALRPTRERNRRRVEAEQDWLVLGQILGCPVQIFRLSGIYGRGRNAFLNLAEGNARRIVKPGQVFNRVHVDDIAGAIAAGLARPEVGPVINVTDDEPAPPQDVVAFAATLLGVEPPPEIPFEEAELSEMGRSFYSDNKRVSNRRLKSELGYPLLYPTYREGLEALASRP